MGWPVGAEKWCKVESETVSPLQSMSGIYRWNKFIQIVPHGRSVECRINVINGLWYVITGADEAVKYGWSLNCSEIRKFSPRSNVRKTERELSAIWYTSTKAILTSWKLVLSISRYYVFISENLMGDYNNSLEWLRESISHGESGWVQRVNNTYYENKIP